eukprot:357267-Chlamydomonas_euryale.AAC.1
MRQHHVAQAALAPAPAPLQPTRLTHLPSLPRAHLELLLQELTTTLHRLLSHLPLFGPTPTALTPTHPP